MVNMVKFYKTTTRASDASAPVHLLGACCWVLLKLFVILLPGSKATEGSFSRLRGGSSKPPINKDSPGGGGGHLPRPRKAPEKATRRARNGTEPPLGYRGSQQAPERAYGP